MKNQAFLLKLFKQGLIKIEEPSNDISESYSSKSAKTLISDMLAKMGTKDVEKYQKRGKSLLKNPTQ